MQAFKTIESTIAVLAIDNIDTDQIIGSDFLKTTDKKGLGQHLFSDWRYDQDGKSNFEFVLNKPITNQSKVLLAGDNFGCGSSREHAPWALLDYGIKVVISSSMADIFYNNAIKNGLLPIQVTTEQHQFLLGLNGLPVCIDLLNQKIITETQSLSFQIDYFDKYCLLNGIDQLDFLLGQIEEINHYENNRDKLTHGI